MWEHYPTPSPKPSVLMKSAGHTGPAEQSMISSRAFHHCCDFIRSLSAKVGEEGLFWHQKKYKIMVKSGRLVLSDQYCTTNTVNALIQLPKWSKMNVWNTSETRRLQEAKIKCTQKRGSTKTIF